MQIKKINHLVIAAYLTITTLNIVSFVQFDRLRLDAKGTIERQRKAGIEANRMIAGSDKLTNSVRDFAATGDPLHEKAYWREVKETQTIEKAEAALRKMGLTDQEIDLIERAKINSDQLIKTEAQAFKAGLEGNLSLSVELVFGENYRKALASIYDPLEQFRLRLDKRLTAETVALERKVDVWWYVSLALSAINAALVIFFIGFFYSRRIVRPLICMKTEVKDMLDGRTST